jgi:O-antigen ligase
MNPIALLFAALMAALSWVVPNHYLPWSSFHGEFLMAAACGLVLLSALRPSAPAVVLSPLAGLALVLVPLPLLHLATGQITYAGDAWLGFVYLLGFALSVWLGQRLAATFGAERVLQAFAGIVLAAALASMGLALYQWLQLRGLGLLAADLRANDRPYANLGQPNHLATLLFMGLVGLIVLYEGRRIGRSTAALGAGFFTFGLAMTTSRTAWLSMALLLPALWLLRGPARLRVSRGDIVALGAVFLGWLLSWSALNEALLLSSGRAFATQAAAGPRTILWSTALEAIQRQPWFGYGWNQTSVAQSDVILDSPAWGRMMGSAHNLLLDLMLWAGVPLGAAIFIGLLAWGLRHLRMTRDATALCALAALAGIFAHAMVELPLHYTYFLLPAGLLAGLLDGHHPLPWRRAIPVAWVWAPAAAALFLMGAITNDYLRVEDNLRTLRMEVARIGTGRIVSEAPQVWLLTQWGDYLRFARIEPRVGISDAEVDHMAVVTRRFPFLRAQFDHAITLGLNGRPSEAAVMLRRLCNLHWPWECKQKLSEWRALAQQRYPQLQAVTLPEVR